MVTFLSITSTGGRLGRIHWANTVPFKLGTIWGQVRWDNLWPRTPKEVLSERMRRATEGVRVLGEAMAQTIVPAVKKAEAAFSEYARALAAAAHEQQRKGRL
jgi:hypothetical protein